MRTVSAPVPGAPAAQLRFDWSTLVLGGVVAVVAVVVLALIALFAVVGFTPRPFSSGSEVAVGRFENSLGHQYRLDAANLSATWTFNEGAQVVVRFGAGVVAHNGQTLQTGCYTGTLQKGDVLRFDGAQGVGFATPDSDPSCKPLP